MTQGEEGAPKEKGRDGPACKRRASPRRLLWQCGLTPCPVPMLHDLEGFKVSGIFLLKVYHEPTRFRSVLHLPASCPMQRKQTPAYRPGLGGSAALTTEPEIWGWGSLTVAMFLPKPRILSGSPSPELLLAPPSRNFSFLLSQRRGAAATLLASPQPCPKRLSP